MLDSPIFIILAIAGIISLPIYLITVIHVLTIKNLEGSFFKIYVANAVIVSSTFLFVQQQIITEHFLLFEPFHYNEISTFHLRQWLSSYRMDAGKTLLVSANLVGSSLEQHGSPNNSTMYNCSGPICGDSFGRPC